MAVMQNVVFKILNADAAVDFSCDVIRVKFESPMIVSSGGSFGPTWEEVDGDDYSHGEPPMTRPEPKVI